ARRQTPCRAVSDRHGFRAVRAGRQPQRGGARLARRLGRGSSRPRRRPGRTRQEVRRGPARGGEPPTEIGGATAIAGVWSWSAPWPRLPSTEPRPRSAVRGGERRLRGVERAGERLARYWEV